MKTNLIAVLCLIQLPRIESILKNIISGKYKIHFDIPTVMCDRYGIDFNDIFLEFETYNLFKSSENLKIKTFYNPEVLGQRRPEKMSNISYAYNQRIDILEKVNETFDGVGILNYTVWQPIFRQNQGRLKYFYDKGLEEEYDLYPLLDEKQSIELATMRFEFSSRTVLSRTIADVQKFLPLATWGLFDYPKCNFLSTENFYTECDKEVIADNDKLFWLWNLKIVLCPHIIFPKFSAWKTKLQHVISRLNEAKRIANNHQPPLKIYPYLSLRYLDYTTDFVEGDVIYLIIQQIFDQEFLEGLIIFETQENLNSEESCRNYKTYFKNNVLLSLAGFMGFRT